MTLKLINLREKDIYQIMEWRMLPEVTKYMYTDPKLTKESQIEWYKNISKSDNFKYWIIEFQNNKIGVLNLYDIDRHNKRCFWAYYIADSSYRGKGIGRNLECNIYDYVFHSLYFNKLCCDVLEENDKVVKIHQKFGSKIEGIFKQHIFKNDKFHNIVRMAILRKDWDSIRDQYKYDKIEIE
jgi:UDP-4-amino-4,6-dideoxy-N-acetyl-beta-L-altrosamine N-acetyltransferase